MAEIDPAVEVVRRMMQKILDSPDSTDRDREMARNVLESDPDEIKTHVKFVDLSEEDLSLDSGHRTNEPDVGSLAMVDENMDDWIEHVREERPTTAELANHIITPPPGWTAKDNMEMVCMCLANALQRLAFGSAD